MRLYELTEQWDTVFNMMEDGETDEQVIFDTLEAILNIRRIITQRLSGIFRQVLMY